MATLHVIKRLVITALITITMVTVLSVGFAYISGGFGGFSIKDVADATGAMMTNPVSTGNLEPVGSGTSGITR